MNRQKEEGLESLLAAYLQRQGFEMVGPAPPREAPGGAARGRALLEVFVLSGGAGAPDRGRPAGGRAGLLLQIPLEKLEPGRAPADIRLGPLSLSYCGHMAALAGRLLPLTPQEFSLFYALVSHRNAVLTRGELLRLAWQPGYTGEERTVDTHIKCLRAKLERADRGYAGQIVTFRKIGYMFWWQEGALPPAKEAGGNN